MTQQGGNFLDGLLLGIKVVQGNGVPAVNEPAINFIGATVVDDPTNHRTNVTVSANTNAVSGTGFWHSTVGALDAAAKLVDLSADTSGTLTLTSLAKGGAHTNDLLSWSGTQWAPTSTISFALPIGDLSPGTVGQVAVTNATPVAAWTSLISYETTHGRFTAGRAGSDLGVTIGPFIGAETTAAAIWMGASAPTNANYQIYYDGALSLVASGGWYLKWTAGGLLQGLAGSMTVGTVNAGNTLTLQADNATTIQTLASTGTELANLTTPAAGTGPRIVGASGRLAHVASSGVVTLLPG